jgi:hypothetical protein
MSHEPKKSPENKNDPFGQAPGRYRRWFTVDLSYNHIRCPVIEYRTFYRSEGVFKGVLFFTSRSLSCRFNQVR